MECLPVRIMKMVSLLHEKGYPNVYLYSGMSPSGLNWRFSIGYLSSGAWPTQQVIAHGSLRTEGHVEWCEDTSDPEILCSQFISHYGLAKPKENTLNSKYVDWYSGLLKMLEKNEVIAFYADYDAPHSYLLKYAPGFSG